MCFISPIEEHVELIENVVSMHIRYPYTLRSMLFYTLRVLVCTAGLILWSGEARELYADSAESRNYSAECGKPNGPCNPGYDSQFNTGIAKDGQCPDDSPCEDGYYCRAEILAVGMPEYVSNQCSKINYPCGGYLENCCAPEFTCDSKGPNGEPLTCQVGGGPYYSPGSGICQLNPKCGGTMEPCCQPWGHRDFWKNRETSDGIFSNPSLCDKGHYCNYHTPLRETPMNGTCVPNDPECGLLGKPCCIETSVTAEARDNSMQIFSCNDSGLVCNLASLTCRENQVFDTLEEISELCGKPNGACVPAYVPPFLNTNLTGEDLTHPCDKGCPLDYFCALIKFRDYHESIDRATSMCLGPADPDCGKLGKPCCPWKIGDQSVDGDLHCDEFDSEETPLQCRSMFAMNQDLGDKSYFIVNRISEKSFFGWEGEELRGNYMSAIQNSICTATVECGSENNPCCHDYQAGYVYTNPKSINNAGNASLLCADGLFCRYDNFTVMHPQGTCVSNDPECGQQKGSPCCKRSLTSTFSGVRGIPDSGLGHEEFYCRNNSVQCEYTGKYTVLQFGKTPRCVALT